MYSLEHKRILVIGDDAAAVAANCLLRRSGATVTHVPDAAAFKDVDSEGLDFAVLGKSVDEGAQLLARLSSRNVPMLSDLELGFRQARCLTIAVAGTIGRSCAARLLTEVLCEAGRSVRIAGDQFTPICDLVENSRELDFLTAITTTEQLLHTEYFRPSIAVLLNLSGNDSEVAAAAKLLGNQQSFDWAVVQLEAYAELKKRKIATPGKVITFSATDEQADIFLDRGLIISRMEEWTGPLIDLGQTNFRGSHFAEDLMVSLAVSRVLRLRLEDTVGVLKRSKPIPHCCEYLGSREGVAFINDARSSTIESLRGAIDAVSAERAEANIWLIAGGDEKGLDYHSVGPLLSTHVKGVVLFGKSREKLRSAWSLFTPCTLADSLLEAVTQAAAKAACGDTILFSPACSSSDLFQNDQHRGEVYREQVAELFGTFGGGELKKKPKMLNVAA